MGTDHYARASLGILCHRVRLDGHGGHEFRKDIPFLLLLVASKPGEVVNFFVVSHGAPPKVAIKNSPIFAEVCARVHTRLGVLP